MGSHGKIAALHCQLHTGIKKYLRSDTGLEETGLIRDLLNKGGALRVAKLAGAVGKGMPCMSWGIRVFSFHRGEKGRENNTSH